MLNLPSEKAEAVRRAGLVLGPAILASVCANAVYGSVCGGIGLPTSTQSNPMSLVFLPMGVYLAWQSRGVLSRAAWAIFAVYQALPLLAELMNIALSPLVQTSLLTTFAATWTVAAFDGESSRRALVVTAAFSVAFLLVLVGRYYEDGLLGTHSVMTGPIC
jgi:hypothetical protein